MTIGDRIRELRLSKGLTQKQLGEKCGMVDSAIRRYESGRGNPTEKTLSRIADALGVFVADLVPISQFEKIQPERLLAESIVKFYEEDGFNDPQMNAAFEKMKADLGLRIVERFNDDTGKKELDVFLFDSNTMLFNAYEQLNDEGRTKVVEYAEYLVHTGKYQRTQDESPHDTPHESPDTPTEGETPPEGE